jgi:hypothetical protein
MSRQVVVGAAERLREGAFAHVLCNWVQSPGAHWSAPLVGWVGGTGCDALLLRFETLEPLLYAAQWNQSLAAEPERLDAVLDEWLAYYRATGWRRSG